MVCILKMVEKPLPCLASRWSHLREPYRRFHRLNLAKERAKRVEIVMPPMLKQPGRFRRDLPGIRVRQRPPLAHLMANSIDQRSLLILLRLSRKPFALIKNNLLLLRQPLALLRLRYWGNELRPSSCLHNPLRRLAVGVKLPVALR